VVVDFLPSGFTVPFGGVAASASLISGLGRGFGIAFAGDGDELLLNTFGAGQQFANLDVAVLAGQLERVLAAMTADPARPLSSLDLLGQPERARLEELGNWAALTRGATAPVSVPAMYAAQVARTPQAVAISGESSSLTYTNSTRPRTGSRIGWPAVAWARAACGGAVAPFRRGRRGDRGGAQDGRLPADRSRTAAGPDRVHAHRRRTVRRHHHCRPGRPTRRIRRAGHRSR